MSTVFEYIPNERNNLMLVIDNYAFNKYKSNDHGTISYRCKYYQTNSIKCKSRCTIRKCQESGNDYIVRKPKDHVNHPPLTVAEKNFKTSLSTIKKICSKPPSETGKVNPKRVFNKVIGEFMEKEGVELTTETAKQMPKYENYKKQLYRMISKPFKEIPKLTDEKQLNDDLFRNTGDY
jgi:hypothetical protein